MPISSTDLQELGKSTLDDYLKNEPIDRSIFRFSRS